MSRLRLACIADDFTGATDLALALKQAGYSVIQVIGIPKLKSIPAADALVVALKTRSCPSDEAVEQTIQAAEVCRNLGAEQYFFKYCSTFDSTAEGNIGPVTEALMGFCEVNQAIVCPAFPKNGRTVYKGHLFVHGQLLSESSMKDHPVTPMRDSNLVRVLKAQVEDVDVKLVDVQTIEKGVQQLSVTLDSKGENTKNLNIVDALHDQHLHAIAKSVCNQKLVTGGSAIAGALAQLQSRRTKSLRKKKRNTVKMPNGRKVIFAGSCSSRTLEQIRYFENQGYPTLKLDVSKIANGKSQTYEVTNWAFAQPSEQPILIYTSSNIDERTSLNDPGFSESLGYKVENYFAKIARQFKTAGFRQFVVAGGETSGAVVKGLGVDLLYIDKEIDPGVPWTISQEDSPIGLALKSGNFGELDFFKKAFDCCL